MTPIVDNGREQRGTFNFLDFLSPESLLVLHQVAPGWKPVNKGLDDIEPLHEIERLMQEPPQGSQALMVKH